MSAQPLALICQHNTVRMCTCRAAGRPAARAAVIDHASQNQRARVTCRHDLDVGRWHLQTYCPSFLEPLHKKRSHRLTDRLTTGREATAATSSNRRPKQSRASVPSATWYCASPTKRRAAGTAFVERASSLFASVTPTARRVGAQASLPSPTSDWSARSSH